jgi:GIY-YIG catalytic domain-containing protein
MAASNLSGASIAEIEAAVGQAKQQLVERFFARPSDFFTEADLAAFLAHRVHVELEKIGIERSLVHLQYPTPFRCDMRAGAFLVKTEDDRTPRGKKYRRGAFDVTVFNPAFLDEFADNFSLLKGQRWDKLLPVLSKKTEASEPVALVLFELMYNRDPFWADQARKRGMATMHAFAKGVQLDFDKLRAALAPAGTSYRFTKRIEMLVFDSGLNESAAGALRKLVADEVEVHSISVRPASPSSPWTIMDGMMRLPAASLTRDGIPNDPGVYAWYRSGQRVYVGKADSLRERIWGNHLGQRRNLGDSAFRRNVAEQLGHGTSAALKSGSVELTDEQLETLRAWILSCDVAWRTCATGEDALALEAALKAEFQPPLTKM